MEALETLNRKIFLLLNADDSTAAWLLGLAKILARDTSLLLPLLLAGLWFCGGARRSLAIKSVAMTVVSLAVGALINLVWFHPRPWILKIGHTYIPHVADSSFPSHHAVIFAAIGFSLLTVKETRPLGWGVLAVGVVTGWARIFTGLHFPLDIIGGFALAYAVCRGLSPVWDKHSDRIISELRIVIFSR